MILYEDLENDYQIFDYKPGKGELLLRSISNPERAYNIDLHFEGVKTLMLPESIEGFELSLFAPNEEDDSWMENFGFVMDGDFRIFALNDTSGKVFFINALGFNVYHCPLDKKTSSLGRYENGAFEVEKVFMFED